MTLNVHTTQSEVATAHLSSSTHCPRRKLRLGIFAGMTAIPVVAYLIYVAGFGVNMIFWDEWGWTRFVTGTLSVQSLWSQDQSNRLFIPNLVAFILIRLTRWNDFAFYGLSAACLVATLGLLLLAFWPHISRSPLKWIPVPFVVLTLAQNQNFLWAFQIGWTILLLGLIAGLVLLSLPRLTLNHLLLAMILGVMASFCSLQGLLVWPAGIIVLCAQGQRRSYLASWSAIGVASVVTYFVGFNISKSGSQPLHFLASNWITILKGLLALQGNVVPIAELAGAGSAQIRISEAIGAGLFLLAFAVIFNWFKQGRPPGTRALCVSLIFVSVGFDLLLIPGRLIYGPGEAITSRYITFTWPLLIGIYAYAMIIFAGQKGWAVYARQVALGGLALVQIAVGSIVGIQAGRTTHLVRMTVADIVVNSANAPTALLANYTLPPCLTKQDCADIAPDIAVIKDNRVNVFADVKSVDDYKFLGIVPGGVITPALPEPARLRTVISARSDFRHAWNALSAVYAQTSELRSRYGTTTSGEEGLLGWAIATASSITPAETLDSQWNLPMGNAYFLRTYISQYKALMRVLRSASS